MQASRLRLAYFMRRSCGHLSGACIGLPGRADPMRYSSELEARRRSVLDPDYGTDPRQRCAHQTRQNANTLSTVKCLVNYLGRHPTTASCVNCFGTIAGFAVLYANLHIRCAPDHGCRPAFGIHLKQTGAAAISSIVNSGAAVSCESGTMSTIECGAGNTIVKSGVSNFSFRSYNQLAFATIHEMPTTSLTVSDGQVTVESETSIQGLTQTGGTIVWNGGADIISLTVFKGYFDAGNARKKPTIGSARFLGVAHETIINIRNGVGGASFTDYEIHGTPTMLLPEGFKLQPAA